LKEGSAPIWQAAALENLWHPADEVQCGRNRRRHKGKARRYAVSLSHKGRLLEFLTGRLAARLPVGVNIGPAAPENTPRRPPEDVAAYLTWFDQIAAMESNMIRAYTISPAFYTALKIFNEKASRPLCSSRRSAQRKRRHADLYDSQWRGEFWKRPAALSTAARECRDPLPPGPCCRIYTADVSPYVFAIGPGREVETSIV
jgi:hypothetical protein